MTIILIADEDASHRQRLSKAVKSMSDTVVAVENGQLAWERLQELEDVVLIISDWMMHEMDGPALLRNVRQEERTREIPFLLLTARDADEDVINSFQQGADEYVRKPFALTEVLARSKNLIKIGRIQKNLRVQATDESKPNALDEMAFRERLDSEISRCQRYGGSLCVTLVELDPLVQINNAYGHTAGDAALEALSGILLTAIRKSDVVARYGGEKFAAILPNTPLEGGKIFSDRILEDVRRYKFKHEGKAIPLTISVGLAELFSNEDLDMFLWRVDGALYDAKRSGADRVYMAG